MSALFYGVLALAIVLIANNLFNQRRERLEAKYNAFRIDFQEEHDKIDALFHHYDTIVDGIQWHYVDEGPKDAPAVLFMHGFPETWYSWRYVLPLIDKKYRLIAIDMKGYGRSDKFDEDYRWSTVAEQTKNLMTRGLGINRFYVVGHDWGSIIASVLVEKHQPHILGFIRLQLDLILPPNYKGSSAYAAFKERPQFLYFQWEPLARAILEDTTWILKKIYTPRLVTPFREIDLKYFTYEFSQPRFYHLHRYFKLENWDFESAIEAICKNQYSFPVLQLEADKDPAQPPAIFKDVDTLCPNVELIWIHNCSHFSGFDRPEVLAKEINAFLRRNEWRLVEN